MTPQPGTYACIRTGGFYGWLIRIGTRSKYNHVVLITDTHGSIIEGAPGGARRSNLTAYGTDTILYAPDTLTPEQQQRAIAKAETLIGTPYGWLDIARLSLHALGINWHWLIRAADNEKAMICSQLVATCGEAAGLDWNCGRESPAAVTPADLANRATPIPAATGNPGLAT
jgi:uncharacterized protein YycO